MIFHFWYEIHTFWPFWYKYGMNLPYKVLSETNHKRLIIWISNYAFYYQLPSVLPVNKNVSFNHDIGMILHLKYPILVCKRYD